MARPRNPNPDYNKVPPKGGLDLGGAPPPKEDKQGTAQDKFVKWAKSIGASDKQARDLWFWAGKYNLNAYYWASVIKNESNFRNDADSGQAHGIGQIAWSWIGREFQWGDGSKSFRITEKHIRDYGFNIRFSAFLLADAVSRHGYDRAYLDGYNPNDPNREAAWAKIRQTYTGSKQPWPTPSAGPGTDVPAPGDNTEAITDPFVVGVKKGGKLALTGTPPEKGLRYNGLPIRRSEFLSLKARWEDMYVSYTGKRPSNAQIQQLIQKGWSEYTLADLLSKGKSFTNSPLWKSRAPVYQEAARNLLAPGQKVDKQMIRRAIVNNWTPDVFQAELRKSESYTASNEFKGMTATMSNVYQSIYGEPSEGGMAVIREATLGGWSPDQFAAWLRSQDEYVYTPEYRAKAVSLVERLGFLTGKVATLTPTNIPPPENRNPEGFGPLPDDPRITNKPALPVGPALVPGVQRA